MKKIILGFVVLLGLSVLVFGWGDKRGFGGKYCGGDKKGGIFRAVDKLDLSDEQASKIEAIKEAKFDAKRKLRKEMKKARRANKKNNNSNLSDASKYLSADSFDKSTFIELATTKAKEKEDKRAKLKKSLRTNKVNAQADNIQKIFDILNKEQRSELIILLEK